MVASFLRSQTQKWSVGVDVGAEHVKLVCLAAQEGGFQLMAHAMFKRTNLHGIRSSLHQSAIQTGDLRVSLEDPTIKICKVDLPRVPANELSEVVKWAVKDTLKAPMENYEFRYHAIREVAGEKGVPYIVFAVEKDKKDQRLAELKDLGLSRPSIVEPHIHALSLSVLQSYTPASDDRYAVIDFGKSQALFSVVSTEGLLFARSLSSASGDALTLQLCNEWGLPTIDEAEARKLAESKASESKSLSPAFAQFLLKLSIEIQNSLDNYLLQYPNEPVNKMLLTGGGAQIAALPTYLEHTLRVPTSILDVSQKINITGFEPAVLKEKIAFYGVAMGLAL